MSKRHVEHFARRIAAKKMGLEHDPFGHSLPDDIWQQCIPQAERLEAFKVVDCRRGYCTETISGTCPPDATVEEVKERFYDWCFGGRDAWVKDGRFGCTIHIE